MGSEEPCLACAEHEEQGAYVRKTSSRLGAQVRKLRTDCFRPGVQRKHAHTVQAERVRWMIRTRPFWALTHGAASTDSCLSLDDKSATGGREAIDWVGARSSIVAER